MRSSLLRSISIGSLTLGTLVVACSEDTTQSLPQDGGADTSAGRGGSSGSSGGGRGGTGARGGAGGTGAGGGSGGAGATAGTGGTGAMDGSAGTGGSAGATGGSAGTGDASTDRTCVPSDASRSYTCAAMIADAFVNHDATNDVLVITLPVSFPLIKLVRLKADIYEPNGNFHCTSFPEQVLNPPSRTFLVPWDPDRYPIRDAFLRDIEFIDTCDGTHRLDPGEGCVEPFVVQKEGGTGVSMTCADQPDSDCEWDCG